MSALRDALLRGRKRPRARGSGSTALRRGDGFEFSELRAYAPGDDPRRIDWAATARTGDLQTRVLHEDVCLVLAAIVDESQSMSLGRTAPLAEDAAAALRAWFDAADVEDRCMRIAGDTLIAPAMRGLRSAAACLLSPLPRFSLRESLDLARAVLPRGCALLAISDFFDLDDPDDAILSELGARLDCTALLARDPWIDGLPLRGFVTLVDAETQEEQRFYLGRRERERFMRAACAREASLLARFEAAGWRCGVMAEGSGAHALFAAFGLQ